MTVSIIPRTAWQDPKMPVKGPAMVLRTVTMLPAHYTAMEVIPSDTRQLLRNIQADYTTHRHYSIGYNFAIDQRGDVYECRGFDIKCAANLNQNDKTIAILCLVNGHDPMNNAMVTAFKALGAEAQRRCGHTLRVVGHRDIGATACPGDGVYAQVKNGRLTPGDTPTPKPKPDPKPLPPLEGDMAIVILESQQNPKEFNAVFFAECDAQGRSIEVQWSGNGNDPRVQERLKTMDENFGPRRNILLAGLKNNRLHKQHSPSDIDDSLHTWTEQNFAP